MARLYRRLVLLVGVGFIPDAALVVAFAATEEPPAAAPAVLQLAGSYHWDGVDCGDGPTVTLEADMLVFTMPGTETYRHTVLSADSDTGGYALRVETRVTEPAESEGD